MRQKLIVANWKMYQTVAEGLSFLTALLYELKAIGNREVVLCPPFTSLYSLGVALSETEIKLGAQNLHWENSGAFTGEVSAELLKDVDCSYVIVGHSERRQLFAETNEQIQKKLQAATRAQLIPIFCVGETLAEREKNKTWNVIEQQLQEGLSGLSFSEARELVIAYEPVWAIGTGKNATPEQAQEVHAQIREWLQKRFGSPFAQDLRILYGGSVKAENAAELFAKKDIDGGLVGGASLDAKKFAEIIRSAH